MLESIYKKGCVFEYPKVFQCYNVFLVKIDVTKLLEKYKERMKVLRNFCLSPLMHKSLKTLKKYEQFGIRI